VFLLPYKIFSSTIPNSLVKKRFLSYSRESSILNFNCSSSTIMIFLGSMKNLGFSLISSKNGTEKSTKTRYRHSQILFTERIILSTIPLKTPSCIIIKMLIRSYPIFLSGSIKQEIQLCV